MPRRKHAILLTGPPGIGKTTALRRTADALTGWVIRGFTTEEIRSSGQRVGFRLETFDGRGVVLAGVALRSLHRVGKYGVDVEAVDSLVESALSPVEPVDVYFVDEIGRMECLSHRFVTAITALLDSNHPLIATVAMRGGGLIAEAKHRGDVDLWQLTRGNRDQVPARVVAWLADWNR
jgi:nucleoside-triphosphatase